MPGGRAPRPSSAWSLLDDPDQFIDAVAVGAREPDQGAGLLGHRDPIGRSNHGDPAAPRPAATNPT
jgi:hypothetical protein